MECGQDLGICLVRQHNIYQMLHGNIPKVLQEVSVNQLGTLYLKPRSVVTVEDYGQGPNGESSTSVETSVGIPFLKGVSGYETTTDSEGSSTQTLKAGRATRYQYQWQRAHQKQPALLIQGSTQEPSGAAEPNADSVQCDHPLAEKL